MTDHPCIPAVTSEPGEATTGLFFHDSEFLARYPGLLLPPPSFVASGAKILAFDRNKAISLLFPVGAHQLNPLGTLQGGILASFFDDAFGVLSFASLKHPCVSVDLGVNFIRAFRPGESVRIEAQFKARGKSLLHLYGEAYTGKGKLAATATANMLVQSRVDGQAGQG